ncbi:hypothetical protein JOQ06_017591 [Pogonophryne albipinna]|uniref:alkaline phosphatase n=1 Tax=Pogonophryne albipinna TaxID=1090488 RepID=A0AAD6B3K8_9TELE|nr:hypothetical protein JOQ06_017591 [Pogonophryne albipinna]
MESKLAALFLLLAFSSCSAKDQEENPEFWRSQARVTLQSGLDRKLNTNVPKNILFFLGDGMGITHLHGGSDPEGKSVGIVTATRVQHATPAISYAHSASRKWYSEGDMPEAAKKDGCTDIVIIGGGRKYMTPRGTKDPEYPADFSSRGKRKDGRNLIDEWQKMKIGKVARYVWNQTDFSAVDPETTDYLMALFEPGELRFEVERDPKMDPSIVETTEKAICILQKNPKGFFLLVEAHNLLTNVNFTIQERREVQEICPPYVYRGHIDQAHYAGRASMALHEAVALDYAIAKGLELTNEEETLTVVMADHSHPFTFNGYPFRGQSILEVIRTRLREEGTKYNSFFQTLRTVPREEGYRGLTTHLVRQIPNTAIVISTYQLVVYLLNG